MLVCVVASLYVIVVIVFLTCRSAILKAVERYFESCGTLLELRNAAACCCCCLLLRHRHRRPTTAAAAPPPPHSSWGNPTLASSNTLLHPMSNSDAYVFESDIPVSLYPCIPASLRACVSYARHTQADRRKEIRHSALKESLSGRWWCISLMNSFKKLNNFNQCLLISPV